MGWSTDTALRAEATSLRHRAVEMKRQGQMAAARDLLRRSRSLDNRADAAGGTADMAAPVSAPGDGSSSEQRLLAQLQDVGETYIPSAPPLHRRMCSKAVPQGAHEGPR
jgi:hypothetical protein